MFKKELEILLLSLIAIFAPIQGMIGVVVVLTVADLIFGLWAAKAGGMPITSAELKRTPIKLLVYLSALLTGFLTQKYLMADLLPLANLISTLIGVTEMKSILESLDIVYGRPILSGIIEKIVDKSNGRAKD